MLGNGEPRVINVCESRLAFGKTTIADAVTHGDTMGLRQWVDRVPERQATRANIAIATIWLFVWLVALAAPLKVVPGAWELWSVVAMGWVRVVPLFTALTAIFGLARWGMLAASIAYAVFCVYMLVGLAIWSGK